MRETKLSSIYANVDALSTCRSASSAYLFAYLMNFCFNQRIDGLVLYTHNKLILETLYFLFLAIDIVVFYGILFFV